MAKMTETVAMQLDPHALRRIDDHPDVQPLAEAHYRLQADQRRLTAALVEVRKIIVSAEREGGDPLVPSRTLRDARRQAEALQDQLIEIQEQLSHSHEALEAARSEAKAELRPWLRKEATQLLTSVLEAAEVLLATQMPLQDLDRRARRLGINLAFGPCYDALLVHRLKQIRQVLARLKD
jgi:hypothetical protein